MADDDSRSIVEAAAKQYGVDPNYMHVTRSHESGNFDYSTGKFPADETEYSRHKGPFQLSSEDWRVYGPKGGNIYDLKDASIAMAAKTKAEMGAFSKKYNRDPTGDDLYMIHNQGAAGYDAHLSNPEGIAWQNVARFYPNESIAKSAIWGNIPDDVKRARGWSTGRRVTDDVNKVTSGDLINIWKSKRAGLSGQADNSTYHPYQAQPQQGQPAQVPQGATAQQPGFLNRSAEAVSRIPSDAQNYYNNSPSLRD